MFDRKNNEQEKKHLYATLWLKISTQNKGVESDIESERERGTNARPRYSEMKKADKWP